MIGLAITCYNAPQKCNDLLASLQANKVIDFLSDMEIWINDQSTSKESSDWYKTIADLFKIKYVHSPHEGATASKRQILETAWDEGVEFLHQMSEDFIINTSPTHVTNGLPYFLNDSINLFTKMPIDFVKWNIITPPDGDMQYQWKTFPPNLHFNLTPGIILPYLTGDVVYSNWPGTWKVSSIRRMWEESKDWKAPTEHDAHLARHSGGEWAASMSRIAKGVCLVAQPLVHSRRHTERAEGSKP